MAAQVYLNTLNNDLVYDDRVIVVNRNSMLHFRDVCGRGGAQPNHFSVCIRIRGHA